MSELHEVRDRRQAAVRAALEGGNFAVREIEELEYRDRFSVSSSLESAKFDAIYDRRGLITSFQVIAQSRQVGPRLRRALDGIDPELRSPKFGDLDDPATLEAAHRHALAGVGLTVVDADHSQYRICYLIDDDDGRSARLEVTYNKQGRITFHRARIPSSDEVVARAAAALGLVD